MRLNGLAIRAQSSARRAEVFSGLRLIKPASRCVKKSLGDVNETMDGRSRSAPRVFPDRGTAVSYSVFLLWLFIHLFISNHRIPFVNHYIFLTFSPHKLQLFIVLIYLSLSELFVVIYCTFLFDLLFILKPSLSWTNPVCLISLSVGTELSKSHINLL